MIKVLIDTMHIAALLTDEGGTYSVLAQALDEGKIAGVISVVTLTELAKILGIENYREKINQLISSKLIFVEVDKMIAICAGELRLKYGLPTADSLIAATGIVENVKHILTDDSHFDTTKNQIKPVDLKTALKLASK